MYKYRVISFIFYSLLKNKQFLLRDFYFKRTKKYNFIITLLNPIETLPQQVGSNGPDKLHVSTTNVRSGTQLYQYCNEYREKTQR